MSQPPPPPPHGNEGGGGAANTAGGNRNGLPPGNYDIFVIPPHSAGSGFLYLPSLQPHRNSFLAGVCCTLFVVLVWTIVLPVLREWLTTIMASGGTGVIIMMVGVAVAGWAWGKTSMEGIGGPGGAGAGGASSGVPPPQSGPQYQHSNSVPPGAGAGFQPPPQSKPGWTRSTPAPGASPSGAQTSWEKAREETRKKEEERKRAEELRKKREDDERERVKQREKDARERELREARERREREAKEARQKEEKDRPARGGGSRPASPTKNRHQQPTARTEAEDDAYSFRPYDKPRPPRHAAAHTATASSVYSESYAPSQSTRRTTPPPSQRGPYRTKDEDKIVIRGVYAFNNAFMSRPLAQLVSGVGPVTDGLILRISTEGLFIDDDVRGVPQREWDVKAWTLKLIETAEFKGFHVLRATIRDQEGKRYVFVLKDEEAWKSVKGIGKLKKGPQVRALQVNGLPMNETRAILSNLGWVS